MCGELIPSHVPTLASGEMEYLLGNCHLSTMADEKVGWNPPAPRRLAISGRCTSLSGACNPGFASARLLHYGDHLTRSHRVAGLDPEVDDVAGRR